MRMAYEFCRATAGKQVPSGQDWIHEVSTTATGCWSFGRMSAAACSRRTEAIEATLKNRQKHFVIDGVPVVLGVDGISDLNALHF
jgi:hypothetical protein